LEDDSCSLSYQDEIREAVYNHGPVAFLYHIGENGEGRRQTRIAVRENIDVGALGPVNGYGSVYGLLYILPVKVERRQLCIRK